MPRGTHDKSKGVNIPGIRSESGENEFGETAWELGQSARSSRPFERRKFSKGTHAFRCCAEEDQFGTESTLGKKNLERLSNYDDTQAHIVSGRQKEDRSGAAGKVGEGPRWQEGSLRSGFMSVRPTVHLRAARRCHRSTNDNVDRMILSAGANEYRHCPELNG